MKQLFSLVSGFAILLLASCGSSENKEATNETPAVTTPVTTGTSSQPATSTTISTSPATTTTVPTTSNTPVTSTTQPVTTTSTTAAGLNPAHGQPGHRCDISVGAPLNSAPRPAVTTTPSINTTTTAPSTLTPSLVNTSPTVTTPATTQAVAPGMNPAHGQPNHRCDIAVGAPLNSPVKPTVTTTPVKQ